MSRQTYTAEGWAALAQAARAYNAYVEGGDAGMIAIARGVFDLALTRVNRDCVMVVPAPRIELESRGPQPRALPLS